MKQTENRRRDEALDVLKTLARRLRSLNADLIYVALTESGFTEDEACRFTGALFRTAKARGWLTKTEYSVKSVRNHSNLQSVWYSNLFGKQPNGRAVAQTEIKREYARWKDAGYTVPDHLATAWKVAKESERCAEVSFQQPPQHSYYGATVMKQT